MVKLLEEIIIKKVLQQNIENNLKTGIKYLEDLKKSEKYIMIPNKIEFKDIVKIDSIYDKFITKDIQKDLKHQ